jgi:hypothetical protein
MYFNQFPPDFAFPASPFRSFPAMGYVRPWNWFGARMSAMNNWMGGWIMSQSTGWMAGSGWSRYQSLPWFQHRPQCCWAQRSVAPEAASTFVSEPVTEPTRGLEPVAVAVAVAQPAPSPVTPSTPAAAKAPIFNAPKEGAWSNARGGYVLGQSGEVQVDYKDGDGNDMVQYRTAGGMWTDLGGASDMLNRTGTITGEPGSLVEFRIRNFNNGEYFRGGTTQNVDGKDHASVRPTGNGYRVGFDRWADDDGDFDDINFDLVDRKAKG